MFRMMTDNYDPSHQREEARRAERLEVASRVLGHIVGAAEEISYGDIEHGCRFAVEAADALIAEVDK